MDMKQIEQQTLFKKLLQEGRMIRKNVPRSLHSTWKVTSKRPHLVPMLLAAKNNRLPYLMPLRYGRMSVSPFAFMRGTPEVMGADLANTAQSGIHLQICGDCHLGNFGAFASPERRLLFDITDFDETIFGPWEFDIKRLAVSFILLALQQGLDRQRARDVVLTMLRSYRKRLRKFAKMSPLEVWHYIIDADLLIRTAPNDSTRERRIKFEQKARTRTADKLIGKLIIENHGKLRFIEDLPIIRRLEKTPELKKSFKAAFKTYPESLSKDRGLLFSHYHLCDLVFKVVGVGSVGTHCGVALFEAENGHQLLLQIKEACRSVLEPFIGKSQFLNQGERVVVGQKIMQCASDIFLGWGSSYDGRSYYMRQLRDMKTNLDMKELKGEVLINFGDMCGWVLARAHAKSGNTARLSGYAGKSDQLDEAIADFSESYADQCYKDYELFQKAIRAGKISIELEER